jgi:hypothetical protein
MQNLRHPSLEEQAWAYGTLSELEMIAAYQKSESVAKARSSIKSTSERVIRHCREIVELMGPESFHVQSTKTW